MRTYFVDADGEIPVTPSICSWDAWLNCQKTVTLPLSSNETDTPEAVALAALLMVTVVPFTERTVVPAGIPVPVIT